MKEKVNKTNMKEKEKLIKKIVVNVGGLKGLVLEGTQESIKENKIAINGFKDTVKHPIHLSLEDKIEELRFNVLDISGIIQENTDKNEKKSLIASCDILAIEFEKGSTPWFKIKASSRVFVDKFQILPGVKVEQEDGYEYFDTVMKIIDAIIEEIGHYVNKTKVISDEELMTSFVRHGKGKGIDMEMMSEMSAEEKAEWLHEELGKMGFLVNSVHVDEMNDSEVVEEVITETEIPDNVINFNEPKLDIDPLEFEAEPIKLRAK